MAVFGVKDVLNPKKIWLGNTCYRVNNTKIEVPKQKINMIPNKSYLENDIQCDEISDFDIEVTENGRFKTSIRLPQAFYSYIIGSKGSRRKRLEDETKTDILIPKQGVNNKIIITGSTERNVVACRNRLEMIGNDLRRKHSITHFISIPLVDEEIKKNFLKFKDSILAEGHIDGIDESIFQKVDKIHLTIGTLVLLDEAEREEAAQILENCKSDVIIPQLKSNLQIKIKGLEYMNDDPAQVDVLYAKVQVLNHENSNILQKISDDIVNYFYSKGIMQKETANVKLHATLINTRYRKDSNTSESQSHDRKKSPRIAFDARPILNKFANFEFGEQQLNFIHLSHRFSIDENGYYEPVHKITCS